MIVKLLCECRGLYVCFCNVTCLLHTEETRTKCAEQPVSEPVRRQGQGISQNVMDSTVVSQVEGSTSQHFP